MLEKRSILPVGSMVTVTFAANEGRETFAVIVGHLTLREPSLCHYDYICVEYPGGVECSSFFINDGDILRIVHRADDTGPGYEKWLQQKYREYQAYYSSGQDKNRMTIDEVRYRKLRAEDKLYQMAKYRKVRRVILPCVFVLSVGISMWCTQSMLLLPIALFCAGLGIWFER